MRSLSGAQYHTWPSADPSAIRPAGDTATAVDRELGIEIAICGDPKTRSSTALIEKLGDA